MHRDCVIKNVQNTGICDTISDSEDEIACETPSVNDNRGSVGGG
jgi:hypothetical protein